MAASDWEEIKRLAADFQRIQQSSSSQRLSERNCIEIVQKLINLRLIEVIYTTDGKEYLTPQELSKEIREELCVSGGRINLVDLQQSLNVDLSHIETKVNELIKSDKSLKLILGQLIDRNYLDRVGEEINDKLQAQGIVTVAELAKSYSLPGDILREVIVERLGTIVKGKKDDFDSDVFYTDTFIKRHLARIRGALASVTKPSSLGVIINRFGFQERLFFSLLDKLIADGQISGVISGSRPHNAIFVPEVYTKAQNEWVDSFFSQNSYLEYDSLLRLGITDTKSFIKKRLKGEQVQYLESCCVGSQVMELVESEIDEALTAGTWINIMAHLPSICMPQDARLLLQTIVKRKSEAVILADSYVTRESFLSKCLHTFDQIIKAKAEKAVRDDPSLLVDKSVSRSKNDDGKSHREDKKDERRKKAASGKSGGGLQGREVKMKSTKKKTFGNKDVEDASDEDDNNVPKSRTIQAEFMNVGEICEHLRQQSLLKESSEEFVEAIAAKISTQLNRQYSEELKSVFLQTMQISTGGNKKKIQSDLSEKIVGLWANVKLFEKGVKLFIEDIQSVMIQHLLKTVCTEITNLVFNIYAADSMLALSDDKTMTQEDRMKILSVVDDNKAKSLLTRLQSSLAAKNLEDFFTQLDAICGPGHLEISLRKLDKSKERQLVFNHRQSLAEQLGKESDPAMGLHIASMLIFQVQTQCMVFTSGRCVPHIIAFLKEYLPKEQHDILLHYQDLVIKQIKSIDEDTKKEITTELDQLLPQIKDIALHTKRTGTTVQTQ